MTDLQRTHAVIEGSLAPGASPAAVAEAVEAICELGRRAYRDEDPDSYDAYQRLLFGLHYGPPSRDHWRAQYIASSVYDLEDQRMSPGAMGLDADRDRLDADELRDRLWAQQHELTPLRHPMFMFLFEDNPTHEQVTVYLRQQWLILQFFWLQFVELAGQMERGAAPIDQLLVLYGNVWEELGSGDPSASHVEQHRRRQAGLGISVVHRQVPDFPETMDYVNTRLRLMRSADPSAALGAIFSQEATAQSYGAQHHEMLQRVGIPSRWGQVYADHATVDVAHAEEVIELAESLMETRMQQERFLAGHRAQMLVWLAHMDRVVELLNGRPSSGGVPDLNGPRAGALH